MTADAMMRGNVRRYQAPLGATTRQTGGQGGDESDSSLPSLESIPTSDVDTDGDYEDDVDDDYE